MCEKRHLCGSKAHLSAVRTIGAFNVPMGDRAPGAYMRKRVHMNPQGRLHTKSERGAPACMQESDACAPPVPVKPIGAPLRPKRALACEKGHL